MLKKLKSALKSPILQSLLKAGILAFLLYLTPSGWLFKIAFVALTFYFFVPLGQFWASFLALLTISFIVSQWYWALIFVLALIFFLILGIKDLVFINRQPIYQFLNNSLFLLVFLAFFKENKFSFVSFGYLAVFGACFLLFKEFFNFNSRLEANKPQIMPLKVNLLAFSLAFMVFQILLGVVLLPIGFLNASALMLLIILIFKDLAMNYLAGFLNRVVILKNITLFMLFSIIIFAASKWTP